MGGEQKDQKKERGKVGPCCEIKGGDKQETGRKKGREKER